MDRVIQLFGLEIPISSPALFETKLAFELKLEFRLTTCSTWA